MDSESKRSTEVTNPLHNDLGLVDVTEHDDSFDLEKVEQEHLPEVPPDASINNAPQGNDHKDDGHGHGGEPKESKVPMWIQDLIEPVFKTKKRKSTIEVRNIIF